MKKYDAITIGFGQGAHKIAKQLANANWSVAMIEKSDQMYGGSCVNIGCIPTKLMDHDARAGKSYEEVIKRRDEVVKKDRQHNYDNMKRVKQVDIYTGVGAFKSNHIVTVDTGEGTEELGADYIFIDTGSIANTPPIKGINDSDRVYDSTSLQQLPHLPERLGIIGGGNIGLEFASIYASLGSEVTVLERSTDFMKREEPEISNAIQKVLRDKGIHIELGAETELVRNENEKVIVETSNNKSYSFDALLVAVGHKPQTELLNLKNTDIETDDNGGIKVNNQMETTVEKVYAVGDVRGKRKYTYITTDDAGIVLDHLLGEGKRSLSDRKNVPYAIFIDPPLARIGLTEKEAKEKGYPILTKLHPVGATDRADIIDDHRGLYKAVVNKVTKEILGVSLFGYQSHELVNMMKMAMDHHITYVEVRDQIMTHPVMTEIFHSLFDME